MPFARKVMTNLDSILKSTYISLSTKVCLVKAMVCPVVMYGCESWTVKKVERRRIHAFELWCCKRLLRVPWTARRSNQSILKEINPDYSLEWLRLNLKLQYFGHLMWPKSWLTGKELDAGKDWSQEEKGDDRGWDGWMASPTNGHGFGWTPGVGDGQGGPACWGPWGRKEWDTTVWLNWTEALSTT